MSNAANVNPLDSGNDPNSVEAAAADFDRFLQEEIKPSRETRNNRSPRAEPKAAETSQEEDDDKDAPDTDTDDGQSSKDDLHDDILDDTGDGKDEDEDEEGTDDEDEDEDGEKSEGAEDEDEDDLFEKEVDVTVNGETQKLKISELVQGYSREADYRQKTTALAEERKEVEEYAAEAVAERQEYSTAISNFVAMAEALEPSKEDWAALERENPQLFIQTQRQWAGIREKVAEGKATLEKVSEREAADAIRQRNNFIKSENEKLLDKVPALRNPKKAKAFSDTIFAYGKQAGYTVEELNSGAIDHRDIMTLYKAAKYDEIQRNRKTGQRAPKSDPKPAPSSKPRSVAKRRSNTANLRNADKRAAATGSVQDAAMAFTKMLES